MVELNQYQKRYIAARRNFGCEVYVLSSDRQGCMLLVHDPNMFDIWWRVNLNRQGSIRAKFKYQLVPDLVATAA